MPSHKAPAKVGPGVPSAPHVNFKGPKTRATSGIVTARFESWYQDAGGRTTQITYGPVKPDGGGGTLAWRYLGVPDFMDINTNAVSSLPPGIADARVKYPAKHFKAGHLLNAAFGGPGNKSKNLTILSAAGNSRHKSFDNKIKEAFRLLKKAYEVLCKMGLKAEDANLSIMIRVRTAGAWDTMLPDLNICQTLRCRALLEGRSAVAAAIASLAIPAPAKLLSEYNSLVNQAETNINSALKAVPNP